ncbi:MAG: CotH kinase family protein [Firmicutes bacterium]|nr:CotH kinase family protein [Bacillota bacterium]
MLASKKINAVVAVIVAIAVVFTCILAFTPGILGIKSYSESPDYLEKLFDKDSVQSINISVDEDQWQELLDNATQEEYYPCDITINGETFYQVGIRAKGNSSLSTVASSGSDRFSFKIKLDEYIDGQSYHGLSKFVINNMQGDATYMKEYMSYDMYDFMGVATPAYAFADISVNDQGWGLYLAVEAMEEDFAARTYGNNFGELYKPESMDMGDGFGGGDMQDRNQMADMGNFDPLQMMDGQMPDMGNMFGGFGGSGGGADLVYTDDKISSYSQIFDNTETANNTDADKKRVINALKILNQSTDADEIATVVDVDEVLRYFAVNTALVNLDSYVSSFKQNYYLYEDDGVISILPWDLNLSFGGFQGGGSEAVNFPIDTPVSSGIDLSSRPLIGSLLKFNQYTELYHQHLQKIVDEYFNSGYFQQKVESLDVMIRDYVAKDATAFYTVDEYDKAVDTLVKYGSLRAESIEGQLNRTVPSTRESQNANSSALVDASGIDMSDMGSMGRGGMENFNPSQMGGKMPNGMPGGQRPQMPSGMPGGMNFGM